MNEADITPVFDPANILGGNPFDTVRAEVIEAYADCNDDIASEEGYRRRKLHFRASHTLPMDQAKAILWEACPAYNSFRPGLLNELSETARVTIAREGSVCIYVAGRIDPKQYHDIQDDMQADEMTYDPAARETRLWWD